MAHYGKIEYWNERYAVETKPYDWYQGYSSIQHLFTAARLSPQNTGFPAKNKCRVLVLGCGNSLFSEAMLMDGWTGEIINVDYSPVVIDQMKNRYSEAFYNCLPKEPVAPMEWICADVTKKLPFDGESFDLIVCKGTMDAILCSIGSTMSVRKMMQEAHRVLKDHGAMVVVSFANAQDRLVFFENSDKEEEKEWWQQDNLDIQTVPKTFAESDGPLAKFHYVYTCRKNCNDFNQNTTSSNAENEPSTVRVSSPVRSAKVFSRQSDQPTPKVKNIHTAYAARAHHLV